MKSFLFFISVVLVIQSPAWSQDWPQWRGPNRDDVSKETGLMKKWPEGGPKQLWVNKTSGLGYSGFAIVKNRLYTMGLEKDSSYVICLSVKDGKELWRTAVSNWYRNGWGDGPRCTPTVDGDHVYVLSANGDVVCLTAKEGKKVWSRSLVTDFGGTVPRWGYSESVLVDGKHVLCTPGGDDGTVVCLKKSDGSKVWQSEDVTEAAHYSSIIVAKVNNAKQYIQLTPKKLFGLSEKGELLWSSDWNGRVAVIPTPIYHKGKVYVSSGYGVGCKLVDISETKPGEGATQVWRNRNMKNHHGGVILVKDHLYGYSDKVGWACQKWKDGELAWNEKRALKKGAVGYADGHLYCIEEQTGKVALVKATDKGFELVSEFQLSPLSDQRKPQGKIWVHPTIAGGKLFLRDQEIIHCYDIKSPTKKERP